MGVGDRQISLDGWRGMVGHNWGSEHAERWIWLHALTDEGDWLDAAIGKVRMGSKITPWVVNGAVSLEGERHSLGGLGRSVEVREEPGLCEFHFWGAGSSVSGDVSAALEDCVGWVYADPAGGEHHSLNCSVADMRLRVEPKERPRAGASRSAAAPPTSWACARRPRREDPAVPGRLSGAQGASLRTSQPPPGNAAGTRSGRAAGSTPCCQNS